MDVIYMRLSLRLRAILDVVTFSLFLTFVGVLLWQTWEYALVALSKLETSNSVWSPPVYPVKMLMPIGAFMLLLQGVAKFIRDLYILFTGKVLA